MGILASIKILIELISVGSKIVHANKFSGNVIAYLSTSLIFELQDIEYVNKNAQKSSNSY